MTTFLAPLYQNMCGGGISRGKSIREPIIFLALL
jgi:hypothetical protein